MIQRVGTDSRAIHGRSMMPLWCVSVGSGRKVPETLRGPEMSSPVTPHLSTVLCGRQTEVWTRRGLSWGSGKVELGRPPWVTVSPGGLWRGTVGGRGGLPVVVLGDRPWG